MLALALQTVVLGDVSISTACRDLTWIMNAYLNALLDVGEVASSRSALCLTCPDEKEKFEPTVFRDTIVGGLNEAAGDLDAVAKFLDTTGSKLDYRRYADTLFDILIAGSMLGKPALWSCLRCADRQRFRGVAQGGTLTIYQGCQSVWHH